MIAFLYKTITLFLCGSLAYLSISFRMGGIVPDDFVESKTSPSALMEPWRTLGSAEWVQLSERAVLGNNLKKAEQLASMALSRDPTSGNAAAQLALVYQKQGRHIEAEQMADRAHRLWPSRCHTALALASLWKDLGFADKGIQRIPAGCK